MTPVSPTSARRASSGRRPETRPHRRVRTHNPHHSEKHFLVVDVPSRRVRRNTLRLRANSFLVCVNGSLSLVADDGTTREESFWILETSVSISRPMTWGVQYLFSPDAILLCSGRTIMIPGLDMRLPRVQGLQSHDQRTSARCLIPTHANPTLRIGAGERLRSSAPMHPFLAET